LGFREGVIRFLEEHPGYVCAECLASSVGAPLSPTAMITLGLHRPRGYGLEKRRSFRPRRAHESKFSLRHELEVRDPGVCGGPQAIRREDDGRLARERRMRSWVHRVLKEDLGEKVTEAEWTLLWLAAETKIALDGMSPKQRLGKTSMRLQMHLAKILGGLRHGRGHRTNLCTTRTRPRRDLGVTWPSQGTFPGSHRSARGPALARDLLREPRPDPPASGGHGVPNEAPAPACPLLPGLRA
jgi:hypothetical protein